MKGPHKITMMILDPNALGEVFFSKSTDSHEHSFNELYLLFKINL